MAFLQMTYFSRALGKTTRMNLFLPEYAEGPWKVLWLLHGWSEDCTAWQRYSSAERYTDPLQMAVVMPDAHLSFYNDMVHGPKYFTHITEELPEMVSRMFPISRKREDNFIAGLSMGGYGAMKIALTLPEQYAGAGCFSASNFAAAFADKNSKLRMDDPQWLGWMDDIFGEEFEHLPGSRQDLAALADRLLAEGRPAPAVYHCIATGDGGYENAQIMRRYFESRKGDPFRYRYSEGPGIHDWRFWDAHMEECLQHFGLLQSGTT